MAAKQRTKIEYSKKYIVNETTQYCIEKVSDEPPFDFKPNLARLVCFDYDPETDVRTIYDIMEGSLQFISESIEVEFNILVEVPDPLIPDPEPIKNTYSFYVGGSFGELEVYDLDAENYEEARNDLLEKISAEIWTEIKYLGKNN